MCYGTAKTPMDAFNMTPKRVSHWPKQSHNDLNYNKTERGLKLYRALIGALPLK